MTPARDLRDRVAEARRLHDIDAVSPGDVMFAPQWSALSPEVRDFWLRKADGLIATLASLNLAIVEKDAPHD